MYLSPSSGPVSLVHYISYLTAGSWLESNSPNEYSGWLAQLYLTQPTNDTTQEEEYAVELLGEIEAAGFPVTVNASVREGDIETFREWNEFE